MMYRSAFVHVVIASGSALTNTIGYYFLGAYFAATPILLMSSCCIIFSLSLLGIYSHMDKKRYRDAMYNSRDENLCTYFRRHDGYLTDFNEGARLMLDLPNDIDKCLVEDIRIPNTNNGEYIRQAITLGVGGANCLMQYRSHNHFGLKQPRRIIASTTGIISEAGMYVICRDTTATFVDPLTACLKREFFDFWLKSYSHNPNNPITAIYCDLDGFKPVNDKYGHLAGDKIIEQLGARLNALFPDPIN